MINEMIGHFEKKMKISIQFWMDDVDENKEV